jgi:predicted CXXCH cytochrome family protein
MLITIELVEEPTAVRDKRSEEAIFSMRGYAPDKRMTAWILLTLIFAVFLAVPVALHFRTKDAGAPDLSSQLAMAANQNWLAGGMSTSHANLAADCRDCHVKPFTRVSDETCISCHEDMRDHAQPGAMFAASPHQDGAGKWLASLREELSIPEGRCGSCHFEHNGPTGVIPSGSQLCVDCHISLDQHYTETNLVNVSDFARRHPEFSPAIVLDPQSTPVRLARISLVNHPKEKNGLTFPHDFHLKDEEVARKLATLPANLRARYGADLDCADCHQPDAAGALIMPIEMETHCSDCHSLAFAASETQVRALPHGEPTEVRRVLEDYYLAQATNLLLGDQQSGILDRQLSADARARRDRLRTQAFNDARKNTDAMVTRIFSEEGICRKCHENEDPATREGLPELTPVTLTQSYLPKARFSHAEHMTGNIPCASCHRAETSSSSADVLMPSITTCRECHDDRPGKTAIASDCLTCHAYHDDPHAGEAGAPTMQPARLRKTIGRTP